MRRTTRVFNSVKHHSCLKTLLIQRNFSVFKPYIFDINTRCSVIPLLQYFLCNIAKIQFSFTRCFTIFTYNVVKAG